MLDKQTQKYLTSCGILPKYHEATLAQFTNDDEAKARITDYIQRFAEFKKKGVGLYLWGDNGTGKTHCLNCAFKYFIKLRQQVLIVSFESMITTFIDGWYNTDARALYEQMRNCDFLAIEELGKEFKSKESVLARTVLDNTLRYRLQMNKPTWLTSNVPPNDIKTAYSEDIASMMREAVIDIQIKGEDFRNKIRADLKKSL